jgi:hypothetical protein
MTTSTYLLLHETILRRSLSTVDMWTAPFWLGKGTAALPGVFVTVHGQAVRLNSVSNTYETQD